MKKVATIVLVCFLFLGGLPSHASTGSTFVQDILALQPGVSVEELKSQVEEIVLLTGIDKTRVFEMMYAEMMTQEQLGRKEARSNVQKGDKFSSGGNEATLIVGPSEQGDFYYTPSATANVNHGHVGLYYSSDTIVESIYPSGVRQISAYERTVDRGSVVKSVQTTAQNKADAANWAFGEIGKSYSLNFATNRSTGHHGAKNCSKLIWSAYYLNSGLDLDVDKGFGVYPRDIRDAPQTTLKRTI